MRTICSREIFTKKCRQQQNFDSDPKEAWHYNHVTFTPIAKNFMLYCRLIYMLSMLYVRLTIKVKVGIPESFKVGCYPHKITGSSHLKVLLLYGLGMCIFVPSVKLHLCRWCLKIKCGPWKVLKKWLHCFVWTLPSSKTQGQSVGLGEKARWKYSETSIKRTPSIKQTLGGVPKLTSHISLYNEPLFSGHLH